MSDTENSDQAPTEEAGSSESEPLLDYNVPQQITYSGQNYIELRLDPSDFSATRAGANSPEDGS
jgi:hypothetical protein